MKPMFEQIDSQPTDIGEITLRRRRIPDLTPDDIFEIKLNDEFLMSSLFVRAEEALGEVGIEATTGEHLKVVVGGLGLGHTAAAALKSPRVASLWVVELLQPVIDWHLTEKVPLGATLHRDPRCHFIQGSFFDLAIGQPHGLVPDLSPASLDAILLDIDHSPGDVLAPTNSGFYETASLRAMAGQLTASGVFAMWSNDPPDGAFQDRLTEVFQTVTAHTVTFYNPFMNTESASTVYVAQGVHRPRQS